MFEAISYDGMKMDLVDRYGGKKKAFALLLVKPNRSTVSEDILRNISYFHHRSGNKLDIYMPGYGAYWGDTIPDSKDVCVVDNTTWSFSNKCYVGFIDMIEAESEFKYSGGCELLLLDFVNNSISYKSVVRIKLDKAIKDGIIDSVEEIIEKILRKFIKNTDTYQISDVLTLNELGISIGKELERKFGLLRVFERSRHYTINNYERK